MKAACIFGFVELILQCFHQIFKISILLENSISNIQDFKEITDNNLLEFYQSYYDFDNLDEMFDEI